MDADVIYVTKIFAGHALSVFGPLIDKNRKINVPHMLQLELGRDFWEFYNEIRRERQTRDVGRVPSGPDLHVVGGEQHGEGRGDSLGEETSRPED